MASDWTNTGLGGVPGVEVTVPSLNVTFEAPDSEALDDESPDFLSIVGQVLPGATFTDPN